MNRATKMATIWVGDVGTRCVRFEFPRGRRAPGLSPIAHVRESANSARRRGTARSTRNRLHLPRCALFGSGGRLQTAGDHGISRTAVPVCRSVLGSDGTQLIVRTEAEKKRLAGYIYRVDADGSDLVNLSKQSGSRHDAMPAWSPDETRSSTRQLNRMMPFRRSM